MVKVGVDHGPASILFMPMIDQKSTDPICILSTMNFVCTLAQKYAMTPILTFDQPLYWKALELQSSLADTHTIQNCFLKLGGFHLCMSFLGAIEHLMQGSGISQIFEQIYAKLSVPPILSGKEMSQGRRAHILMYETLIGLMVSKLFCLNQDTIFQPECPDLPSILQDLENTVSQFMSNDITQNDMKSGRSLSNLVQQVKVFKESHSGSKTALLWLQYMPTVEVFLRFLKA